MVTSMVETTAINEDNKIVNDFSLHIATANGSGSQTANNAILRTLFKMGIPVTGKNLFPSNIKGLPTWYIIRLSKDGYIARRDTTDIVIAMNQKTVTEDYQEITPGGICFYDQGLKFERNREDITHYGMPVKQLTKDIKVPLELKNYIANMVYVGVICTVLGMEVEGIEAALNYHFKGKSKPVSMNMEVVNRAHEWAKENLVKTDPFFVEPMDATEGMIMVDGNTAAGLGAIYGGASLVAWYPITPSTSLVDAMTTYFPKLRHDDETGKATYAVIQAEDELAAIGMIIGGGWAGARAMTATSGPGISLMSEFSGLGYFAEVPIVVWDIMRMGPSTGLPTRVSQGDILYVYTLGHGDTNQVCLLPASMKECFEFGWRAFDVAEQLQTPVFVLSDLDLGMNQWMSEPFDYPDQPLKRGKVLSAEDLDKLGEFGRYRDLDGDGVPYRTLPGTNHHLAAYTTRGTGHNEDAIYSERPDDWEHNLGRLAAKFETAKKIVPDPIVDIVAEAKIGLIAYGSSDPVVREARDRLFAQNIKTSYLRLRALPFNEDIEQFIEEHDKVYIIENNFNGQLCQIFKMELPSQLITKIDSLAHCDGLPLTARWVVEALQEKEQK